MLKGHSNPPRPPTVTLAIILAGCLATLLGQVSLIDGVPLIWPGLGFAVAALWMGGMHYWPEVALGIFCGALAARLPVFPAFVESAGQTAGALCAVFLLGPLLRARNELNRLKDVAAFVFLGGAVSAGVAASIFSAAVPRVPSLSVAEFGADLGHCFLAGVTGVLVVAPPFLLSGQKSGSSRERRSPGEFWFWHGALLACGIIVFSGLFPYAYLMVPFLIALPLRFGHLGGASGLALTGVIVLVGTVKGYGPFADEGGTELFPLQIFLVAVSVTVLVVVAMSAEKAEAEETIRAQAALLDRATDAISVRSLVDGRYRYWNKSAERIYGFTAAEVVGRTDAEFPVEEDPALVRAAESTVRETGEWSGELPQRAKNSRALVVQSRWSLIKEGPHANAVLIIASEITEKKKLEAEMKLVQRLDCIGTLAAGVAHDLNNVLGPIRNTVRVLRADAADPSSQRLLAALEVSAEKGIEMVRQVLSFASGSRAAKGELQIGYLIRAIIKICRATFPRHISIHAAIPRDLATLLGDPTQIHQMLFNLCLNARDAMPRGGALRISAKDCLMADDDLVSFPEARAGPYLKLEVADMGEGIPPRILNQIFDPFFTTKPPGQGTGLGLYTVARIVKDHEGFVRVQSRLEEGTTFQIYLPALLQKVEPCPFPRSGPAVSNVS